MSFNDPVALADATIQKTRNIVSDRFANKFNGEKSNFSDMLESVADRSEADTDSLNMIKDPLKQVSALPLSGDPGTYGSSDTMGARREPSALEKLTKYIADTVANAKSYIWPSNASQIDLETAATKAEYDKRCQQLIGLSVGIMGHVAITDDISLEASGWKRDLPETISQMCNMFTAYHAAKGSGNPEDLKALIELEKIASGPAEESLDKLAAFFSNTEESPTEKLIEISDQCIKNPTKENLSRMDTEYVQRIPQVITGAKWISEKTKASATDVTSTLIPLTDRWVKGHQAASRDL